MVHRPEIQMPQLAERRDIHCRVRGLLAHCGADVCWARAVLGLGPLVLRSFSQELAARGCSSFLPE